MNYKRILIKFSGEALLGKKVHGADPEVLSYIAQSVASLYSSGYEIGIVVGGGNIYRGAQEEGKVVSRVKADHIGMLATVMNAISIQAAIEKTGIDVRAMSAIRMNTICEEFTANKAIAHILKRRVVIFAAGTGNPFFTTDTAAILRGCEIGADVVVKCTKVDGVYSSDPVKDPNAQFFTSLTYSEVLEKGLKVMDLTAISLAKDRAMPIIVCNMNGKDSLHNALLGKGKYTIVS